MIAALALVLALLAPPLRLIPPGWREKTHALDSTKLRLPSALAKGTRTGLGGPFHMSATVTPAPARLGQRLLYRAYVYAPDGARARFVPPASGGDFTWGEPRTGSKGVPPGKHTPTAWSVDSVWIEVPLQIFRTGRVSIPGLEVGLSPWSGPQRWFAGRLPTVALLVLPTVTAADSNATLRPLHGPLAAPWWERIAWNVVAAVALALAGVFVFIRWLRSLRPRPAVAPVARAPVRPAYDPAAAALAALAGLRARQLPEQQRFGEHALELTRILRRFLEATLGTPRPGDSSPELLARLRASRLGADDVQRLEGLLGLWDRVKFARAPLTVDEAHRCESAVEQLLRRPDAAREVA